MIFCPTCRVEMPCSQTGVAIVFGKSHVYMGDEFRCPECFKEIIRANPSGYYQPGIRQTTERFIEAKE